MSPPTSTDPAMTESTTSTLDQPFTAEAFKKAPPGPEAGAEDAAVGFETDKVPTDDVAAVGGGREHVWPEISTRKTWLLIITLAFTMTLNVSWEGGWPGERAGRVADSASVNRSSPSQIMQIQTVTISQETIGDDLNIPTSQIQWLVRPARSISKAGPQPVASAKLTVAHSLLGTAGVCLLARIRCAPSAVWPPG